MSNEKKEIKVAAAAKSVNKPKKAKGPVSLKTVRRQSASHWMRSPARGRKKATAKA